MLALEDIFPPFARRIASGSVELRVLRDDDLPELVELVRGGIQAPDQPMPFLQSWHQQPFGPGSPDRFPTTSLAWWWPQRAQFSPHDHLCRVAVKATVEVDQAMATAVFASSGG